VKLTFFVSGLFAISHDLIAVAIDDRLDNVRCLYFM